MTDEHNNLSASNRNGLPMDQQIVVAIACDSTDSLSRDYNIGVTIIGDTVVRYAKIALACNRG